MSHLNEALQLTNRLTVEEKLQLLEHLSSALRQDIHTDATQKSDWADFLEATYGSLAEDPLKRDQPPSPDQRDSIT